MSTPRSQRPAKHTPRHPFTSYTQAESEREYREYPPTWLCSRLTVAEQDAVRRRLDRELMDRLSP